MKLLILITLSLLSTGVFAQSQPADRPVPCSSAQHGQFDFWIGEWDVTTADGNPAGSNSISKVEGGCILRENWASATSAYTGTSYNFYNQTAEQWEQLWLDNQGGFLKLAGSRDGNQMILQSEPGENAEGEKVTQRITWTSNEDGSVRQLWEVLTAGKETRVAFDGLYKRKN